MRWRYLPGRASYPNRASVGMAYWWVSQNKTYQHEREGQYLWAPKLDKGGKPQHHWTSITEVKPGDVIFSAVQKQIVAVSLAKNNARDASRHLVSKMIFGIKMDGWWTWIFRSLNSRSRSKRLPATFSLYCQNLNRH